MCLQVTQPAEAIATRLRTLRNLTEFSVYKNKLHPCRWAELLWTPVREAASSFLPRLEQRPRQIVSREALAGMIEGATRRTDPVAAAPASVSAVVTGAWRW